MVLQTRKGRAYWRCFRCALIFMDSEHLPDRQTERGVYEKHQNHLGHAGYVNFLRRILDPALVHLHPGMRGLDYGCGPGPTLSQLLEFHGISCENYDPLFFPSCPAGPFDFIFATECFEHFHRPMEQLQHLSFLLKPGGWLFVMTQLWDESINFTDWHYKCDPTHVSFYHRQTIIYLCREYGLKLIEEQQQRVLLLRKM